MCIYRNCIAETDEGCAFGTTCYFVTIYREYLALQRCVHILLRIKQWWWDRYYSPDIFTGGAGDSGALINAALRDAGLQ